MAVANSVEPVSDTALPQHVKESSLTPASAPITKLFSLEDRTVIVTGAGRGLGITLATAVLEAGGDVICLDILPEPSKEDWANINRIQKSSKVSAIYLQCNVVDESAVSSTIAQAAEHANKRRKPIRGLLHCAGIQQMIDAIEYPLEGFRRILDVNVTGSFLLAKHTARLMRDEGNAGSLVLIASMSGQIANRVSILP
jgi:NAD(P)-dependent dehydrogenase (short-subunit alcohol dehydrogenase family)